MTPKSEDQITKDKDAVARMVGAKSAMEAAQRRIELLEAELRRVDSSIQGIQKACGMELATSVYVDGGYKYVKVHDQINALRNFIAKVQP